MPKMANHQILVQNSSLVLRLVVMLESYHESLVVTPWLRRKGVSIQFGEGEGIRLETAANNEVFILRKKRGRACIPSIKVKMSKGKAKKNPSETPNLFWRCAGLKFARIL